MNAANDIVIAGAGPAGITTSLFLCREKIPHILLEKGKFPRDKICGDALSGKVVDVRKKFDEKFADEINKESHFLGSYGVKFVAPNGSFVDIPFAMDMQKLKGAPGFISKRIHFDYHLFKKIDRTYATVIEDADVKEVKRSNDKIILSY